MKKNLFYLLTITILILFCSCKKFSLYSTTETPNHYGLFKKINDTITSNYDIALQMLNSFDEKGLVNNLSKTELYEYHILLAEARYKCDSSITNKKILNDIVIYFDSLTSIYPHNTDILFQNSRAHYYRGAGYEEDAKYKEAFNDYLNTQQEKISYFILPLRDGLTFIQKK